MQTAEKDREMNLEQLAEEKSARGAKAKKIREAPSTIVLKWIARVLMILWSVLVVYPLLWALFTSFKNAYQFMSDPWALPSRWMYSNYADAWIDANFADYFMNSVVVTLGALVLTLIMVSTSSYIIAKYRHPVIRFLERFYALFMMAPQVLLLIPLMYLCLKFNLTNLVTLMILYAIQSVPYYCFMMVPFIRGIDDSFLEAAQIDGANEFYVFLKIILPMAVPAVAHGRIAERRGILERVYGRDHADQRPEVLYASRRYQQHNVVSGIFLRREICSADHFHDTRADHLRDLSETAAERTFRGRRRKGLTA